MDRSASTQNPSTMNPWRQTGQTSYCEVCGRPLAPAGANAGNQWYANPYGPLMDNLNRMWSSMAQPWSTTATTNPYAPLMDNLTRMWTSMAQPWTQPWTMPAANPAQPGTQPHHHHHPHSQPHDCGCEEGDCDGCHRDRCDCRCCISDADLVVYARVGERRVVPLTIENPRRRERQIKLEISRWSGRGGAAANIRSEIVGPTEFTLAACQEHEAILVIETTGANEKGAAAEKSAAAEQGANAPGAGREIAAAVIEQHLLDIDECQVWYADLRVEGCEMRPVRIALALLPRGCAAYTLDCGCNCC